MEDDYFFTEKHSIRESARSLKKYGSTCNHVRNELLLIRHELEKTDTLQGIALKYGCTVSWILCNSHSNVFPFPTWRDVCQDIKNWWKKFSLSFHSNCSESLVPTHNNADRTNTPCKSSVRPRQSIFATVPDDTGGQRFAVLSERWSTTIVANWFVNNKCLFAGYANKFAE